MLERENDVFKKAALGLYRLITYHPFTDGNKRTAFEVADQLLRHEELYIQNNEETISILLSIAKYECTEEKIEKWLIRNTSPL